MTSTDVTLMGGTGWHWIIIGCIFTAIGLFLRYVIQRNDTASEREKQNMSYGGTPMFALGLLGPVVVLVGVILLIISAV
jgi:hypothetical protein